MILFLPKAAVFARIPSPSLCGDDHLHSNAWILLRDYRSINSMPSLSAAFRMEASVVTRLVIPSEIKAPRWRPSREHNLTEAGGEARVEGISCHSGHIAEGNFRLGQKSRLGATFSASPVLVGEKIYAVNESGDFYIFKADPAGLEILAKNKVGDEVFATPSICGGNVFLRVAFYAGEKRGEKLICFGE